MPAAKPASVSSRPANAADAPSAEADSSGTGEIVVIGSGETRSVSTLVPSNLDVLPPGTSIQKALNFLPGVMAQSIDALGVNEQSLSLQVRGFSTTHLGYTLDGIPLGDGAYNNYNGLTISRALISENLGRADLATGIAGLGIPSTSNLGGALTYFSSDPKQDLGLSMNGTLGSEHSRRVFARIDTGEHGGFSAYVSGQYSKQNLFVDQDAGNRSTGKQLNAKAKYEFSGGKITAFADVSRTNQADDPYLSKEQFGRLGWDWGGYAPDWNTYLSRAACTVTGTPIACVKPASPETAKDDNFTNGQILRNDELYYLSGDFDLTQSLNLHLSGYHHHDKGAGNNFVADAKQGPSTQGTASTADDLPVKIRDTRYTINRNGVLGSVNWTVGINSLQAGFWIEDNKSSAVRYWWANVTGPIDLGQYLKGTPTTTEWAQQTKWKTRQFYVQDTLSLLDDALSIDFGFKSTYARADAAGIRGIAAAPAPASTQYATGTLKAKDNFLPEAGVRWKVAEGHEVFASYAENIAMYQGGFKLGPQAVTQPVWDSMSATLRPETSKSAEGGYRYVSRTVQLSLSGYYMKFDNRLLQYKPCATAGGGCANSFHNAGSVTSRGAELGVLWKPLPWLSWYNSASLNKTTYDDDLSWVVGADTVLLPTAGKQQVDTPKVMLASLLSVKQGGFFASVQGKYTGRRYYTFTNDQSFPGVFTADLGLGYDFGEVGPLKGAKLSLNVTNLTNKRYAANFDNSVFAPSDSGILANGDANAVAGNVAIFHSSAPRQVFATLSFDF